MNWRKKERRATRLLVQAALLLVMTSAAASGLDPYHALVIGNQEYRHLTRLKTPLADAKAVAEVLEQRYGFKVELLLDKSRDEIMSALSELRRNLTSEQDNLLIYYAGHGYLDEPTGTGYWQPVDAGKDNTVDWIPTDDITRLLKAVRAKHVLVVADSCYSGSLLTRDSGAKLASGMSMDEWLRRMQAKRSRTALTSGGEEPVADGGGGGHSVFAKAFLEALQENTGILDGDSLFDRIKRPVALNAEQTPLYGDIHMTGHEMGDFLFVPKAMQGPESIPVPPPIAPDLTVFRGGIESLAMRYGATQDKALSIALVAGQLLADDKAVGKFLADNKEAVGVLMLLRMLGGSADAGRKGFGEGVESLAMRCGADKGKASSLALVIEMLLSQDAAK